MVSTHLKNMLVKLDHFPRDRGENKNIWVATTYGLNFLYWGNPLIPPLTGNPICIQGYETTNNTNILNLKQSHFSVGDFHFELGWFDFFSVFLGRNFRVKPTKHHVDVHSLKLTARPGKWIVGRLVFPFGARSIFREKLLVSGRVQFK